MKDVDDYLKVRYAVQIEGLSVRRQVIWDKRGVC